MLVVYELGLVVVELVLVLKVHVDAVKLNVRGVAKESSTSLFQNIKVLRKLIIKVLSFCRARLNAAAGCNILFICALTVTGALDVVELGCSYAHHCFAR